MIIFSLLLAAQAPAETNWQGELNLTAARAEQVANQAIDCMDVQTKAQLKSQMADMTPETVVDAALATCQHLKRAYADAVSRPGSVISPAAGQNLANEFFVSLRVTYVEHIDKFLVKPEFAELRMKFVLLDWRKCVTEKSKNWSRLPDEAKTIAKAAITSCRAYKQRTVSAAGYLLRSKGHRAADAVEMIDSLQSTVEDVAIETIISERAKKLPARR